MPQIQQKQHSTDSISQSHEFSLSDFKTQRDQHATEQSNALFGYSLFLEGLAKLAPVYYQEDTQAYDIAFGQGEAALTLQKSLPSEAYIVAIDDDDFNVGAALRHTSKADKSQAFISWIHHDLEHLHIENASVVVLNCALSRIDPTLRLDFLKRVRAGMVKGGALVVIDRVGLEGGSGDRLRIWRKQCETQAQTPVSDMPLESLMNMKFRLKDAGFKTVDQWFQCFDAASFIALND